MDKEPLFTEDARKSGVSVQMIKAYPAGWPFWQSVGRRGIPIGVRIQVLHDQDAGVYVALNSNLLGLVAEAPTLEELIKSIDAAALDLLSSYLHKEPVSPVTSLTFCPA